MGKSWKRSGKEERNDEETVFVPLDEVHLTEAQWRKLMASDHGQIAEMRLDYESGREMFRVVLRPRAGGGYNVEDGRHRVIAAKLAGIGCIEAIIVGG